HVPAFIRIGPGIDGVEMETNPNLSIGESREVIGDVDPVSQRIGSKNRAALVVAGKHHKCSPVVGRHFDRAVIPARSRFRLYQTIERERERPVDAGQVNQGRNYDAFICEAWCIIIAAARWAFALAIVYAGGGAVTRLRATAGAQMPEAVAQAKGIADGETLQSGLEARAKNFALAITGRAEAHGAGEVANGRFK